MGSESVTKPEVVRDLRCWCGKRLLRDVVAPTQIGEVPCPACGAAYRVFWATGTGEPSVTRIRPPRRDRRSECVAPALR